MELPLASSKASFRGVANAWGLQLMICMILKGSPILHRGFYYCEGFYNCSGSPWGFIIAMVWSCSGACCLQISIGSIEICRRRAAARGDLVPTGILIRSCSYLSSGGPWHRESSPRFSCWWVFGPKLLKFMIWDASLVYGILVLCMGY